MRIIKFYIILFCFSIFCQKSVGQLIGGEAFLQGNYIEIGVSACGSYGTNSAPAGYHDNTNNGLGLGFVADGAKDGWTTGTPAYCGDYFLPGNPEEGWTVEIGGTNYSNSNGGTTTCSSIGFPGSITSYSNTGGILSAIWAGAGNGLSIEKCIYFPQDSLYFVTKVSMINTSGSTLSNVYYMRNLDPDNEIILSGSYYTKNSVIYQNPSSSNKALVTAVGNTYGCYIGLGTIDSRAQVTYGGFTNRNASNVWNGTGGLIALGLNYNCDCAISLAFFFGDIAPGDAVNFSYVYILDESQFESALQATNVPTYFANGVDITDTGTIQTCAGYPVAFNIQGGNNFNWNWSPNIELDTDIGRDVVASPTSTRTYNVTGVGQCEIISKDITILVDSVTAFVQADSSLCSGENITLNANGVVSYSWTPDALLDNPNIANPLASPTATTIFSVLLTDTNTCQKYDSVTIYVNPLPTAFSGNDTLICFGDTANLNASGGINYVWTPNINLNDDTIFNPIAFPTDTTQYFVLVTDTNGCKNADSVTVFIQPLPVADIISSSKELCIGKDDSIRIDGSIQNGSFFWTHNGNGTIINNGNDTIFYLSDNDTGIVKLFLNVSSALAACGIAIDSTNLEIHSLPTVSISSNSNTICENTGDTIQLKSSGAVSYQWQEITVTDTTTLSFTNDSILTTPNEWTKYVVTVTDTNGCVNFAEKNITLLLRPAPEILTNSLYECYPATINYEYLLPYSTPIDSVVWVFDNGDRIVNRNPISHVYEESMNATYPAEYKTIISLYYQNRCNITDTVEVSICENFYLPNVFTPDGDGSNDFFEIKGIDMAACKFSVFNRWGEKVYDISDYKNDWEGTDLNGNKLKSDTYFYMLGCNKKKYTGWMRIIR